MTRYWQLGLFDPSPNGRAKPQPEKNRAAWKHCRPHHAWTVVGEAVECTRCGKSRPASGLTPAQVRSMARLSGQGDAFVLAVARAGKYPKTSTLGRLAYRAEWPDRKRAKEQVRMTKRQQAIREGARAARERDLAAGTHPSQRAAAAAEHGTDQRLAGLVGMVAEKAETHWVYVIGNNRAVKIGIAKDCLPPQTDAPGWEPRQTGTPAFHSVSWTRGIRDS